MSAWNPQAIDIFLNALDIAAPADRSAYIQQACRDDGELLAQVQSLIAASQKAGSFLENPALAEADLTIVQPLREAAGTQIGPCGRVSRFRVDRSVRTAHLRQRRRCKIGADVHDR